MKDESDDIFGKPFSSKISLLIESLNREKNLIELLKKQQLRNDELELQLNMELKQKLCIMQVDSSTDETDKSFEEKFYDQNESYTDLKDTFGTNSTLLMQYKYDELRNSHSKCVKKLCKKSKQLKKVMQEAEILKFKNLQLSNENSELVKKIEQIGFRFFDLLDLRSEEEMKLQTEIQIMQKKLLKH